MGIEKIIGENIIENSGSVENVSEKYDRMRQEKMERLYTQDSWGHVSGLHAGRDDA